MLGVILICLVPSFFISKLPFKQWYAEICMCGVRRLAYSMAKLSRKEKTQLQWWEPAYAMYWGFTIKYFIPCVLWFLIVGNVKTDIDKPYGKYAAHWQAIGLIVPLLGLVAFLFNICFCLHTEVLDPNDFEDRFSTDFADPWDNPKASEMQNLSANQVAATADDKPAE